MTKKLFHLNDTGLILQSTATGDDSFPIFSFQPAQTTINDGDVIGMVTFVAAGDTAGGDANATAAAIRVSAEADFSSSVNKTKMEFQTGASEAATTKLSILNDGRGLSPFTARAWARIDQTGTLQSPSNHNVTSLTDNGTGDSTVTFTNAIGSTEYCVVTGNAAESDWGERPNPNVTATGSVRIQNANESGTLRDSSRIHFVVMYTGV